MRKFERQLVRRNDRLSKMAGLSDIRDISRRLTRHRRLPRADRRSPAHDPGVHLGRPSAEGPSDGRLATRLLPVGHHGTRYDGRDVHVRVAGDAHGAHWGHHRSRRR